MSSYFAGECAFLGDGCVESLARSKLHRKRDSISITEVRGKSNEQKLWSNCRSNNSQKSILM
ncbi:hypothetical protein CC79DRAFT_1330936 [Sarocladium strictum]